MELEGAIYKTDGMSPSPKAAASSSVDEIATIRIELCDTDPQNWRVIEVTTSITLKVLHNVIQAVMGRSDYHLWEFTICEWSYDLQMDN